jgi:DNA-binding transcriptional LysR family regulator
MKLHLLRYFVVLAEELHFGRAADRLAITQPPLSLAIKSLEEELGVQLLIRSSKNVVLTAPGEALLQEARQIMERVARATAITKAAASGLRGYLEIGMAGSLVYRGVPAIIREFSSAMPGVNVVLREMSTSEQLHEILQGRLDAGFLNASTVPPQFKSVPLVEDEFVACLPDSHRHADAKAVALKDLAQDRFVMFARDVSPANYDNVVAIFSKAGIHPLTVHAARQWLTVVAMVAEGLGVSLVPQSLTASQVKGVRFVPLGGTPAPAPALLVWNPAHVNPALARFIEGAMETIKTARKHDRSNRP